MLANFSIQTTIIVGYKNNINNKCGLLFAQLIL